LQASRSGNLSAFLSIRGNPENSKLMTEYMGGGNDAAPFHLGKQSNKEIRAIFLKAGFRKVTLWRRLCVSDVFTSKNSVENYRKFASSVQRADGFWEDLGERYQGWLDKGEPIGLEAVIVVCMK
jgi:hypothetical protein